MYHFYRVIAGIGLATLAASAGQIQIGDGTNGNLGLTASYVTVGGTANSNLGTGSPSGPAYTERNYDYRLYANASSAVTPTLSNGTYTRYGGQTAGSTFTDPTNYSVYGGPSTGVTFALISDGCQTDPCPAGTSNASLSDNFWTNTGGNGTLTIPVGIAGVTDVWTMLNDVWGTPSTSSNSIITPSSNTKLVFNFGTTANATTFSHVVEVTLNNALAGVTSTPFGQIRSAVDCTAVGSSNCNNVANGPLAPVSLLTPIVDGVSGSPITVLTHNISTQGYTSIPGSGTYAGSQGNAVLDSQGFLFGSDYASFYLVNVQVINSLGTNNGSQAALSAITVDAAGISATPEPASALLLLGGLGIIGFRRRLGIC